MWPFKKKTCPLETAHLVVYGVHSPRKWKKEDCQKCEYQQNQKCIYNQKVTSTESSAKRGAPALVKRSMMDKPAEDRQQAEKEAVARAGFNPDEERDYWSISLEYDGLWSQSSEEQKQDILESLGQWKVYLESGLGPAPAQVKVKDWLRKREEFRHGL